VQTDHDDLFGAVFRDGSAHFRVWAPEATRVRAEITGDRAHSLELTPSSDGYWVAASQTLRPGTRYKYCVDANDPWPDPCSRFQPDGPHGPSQLIDVAAFQWSDSDWRGAKLPGQVIYELHVGAFTDAGTFDAAIDRLEYLSSLGVTMLELLPVVTCGGRFNWGYDGVALFAPSANYGDHFALKRFVDRAHAMGIAVILDVVYNHLGPDGNYLKCYSPHYFSTAHRTEWGETLNFDARHCNGARDFIIANAKYWLHEFHIDGFRLDATQSIFDASSPHILAQLIGECRSHVNRDIVFIAENEPQRGEHLLPPEQGGFGLDGMWNDDYHHSLRVALTGSRDGYFLDYTGRAQEIVSAVKHGFLYQGQYYRWQKKKRGSPLRHAARSACVHFLQNHDQIANTGIGQRLHDLTSMSRYRAATALLLLGPQTPLLFMGQEFCASRHFMFFADHPTPLRDVVFRGRREFITQFTAYATEAVQAAVRDPGDERTFQESKLDWHEATTHAPILRMHEDLLRLRRADAVLLAATSEIDGAVLTDTAFVLRWFDPSANDRLLIVNLGTESHVNPASEPLLAPALRRRWQLQWSSEDPRYGGRGVFDPETDGRWRIPAESTVLMIAVEDTQ
jgi:maltooligosyltrehalose trehalohydrolase